MLKIRDYEEADHDAVWTLHNNALAASGAHAGEGPWDDDLHNITEQYINRGGVFLVGLLEGRLIAMGALKRIDSVTGEIKRMRVVPDYQRRGYGTAMLLALEQRADELGITKLKLDTTDIQMAAQSLYRKHGYREISRYKVSGFTKDLLPKGYGTVMDLIRPATSARLPHGNIECGYLGLTAKGAWRGLPTLSMMRVEFVGGESEHQSKYSYEMPCVICMDRMTRPFPSTSSRTVRLSWRIPPRSREDT